MNKLDGKVTRYFCDRCLKSFAESTPFDRADAKDDSVARGATLLLPVVAKKKVRFGQKDLCGSCVTALSKWMEGKEKL